MQAEEIEYLQLQIGLRRSDRLHTGSHNFCRSVSVILFLMRLRCVWPAFSHAIDHHVLCTAANAARQSASVNVELQKIQHLCQNASYQNQIMMQYISSASSQLKAPVTDGAGAFTTDSQSLSSFPSR